MSKIRYKLLVSYPLTEVNRAEIDTKIKKAVNHPSDGSGAGLGMRDIDWSFTSKTERDQAYKRVYELNMKDLEINVDQYEDD